MNKKLVSLFTFTVLLVALPVIVRAQVPPIDVAAILNNVTNVLFIIFAGLVVIMFLWAGVLYLTAQGDPGQIQKANKAVIFALVGTAVGLLGYSVKDFICNDILNLSC